MNDQVPAPTETSMMCQIVFRTKHFAPPLYDTDKDPRPNISILEIQKAINSNKVELKFIDSYLTTNTPPVIIVTDKRTEKEVSKNE